MDMKKLLLSVLRTYDFILWMYPSLFDQSTAEGLLNCFYSLQNILLLQNSAVMNNRVHHLSFFDIYKCLRSDSPRGGVGKWIWVCVIYSGSAK